MFACCEEEKGSIESSHILLHWSKGLSRIPLCDADMAQLVEHHLAKVGVAGSNPVVRSRIGTSRPSVLGRLVLTSGDVAKW